MAEGEELDLTEEEDYSLPKGPLLRSGADWWCNAHVHHEGDWPGLDVYYPYAQGYLEAADILAKAVAEGNRRQSFLVFPIAFLYRQSAELRLKMIIRHASMLLGEQVPSKKMETHRMEKLCRICGELLAQLGMEAKNWLDEAEECLEDLGKTDPDSGAFRYPNKTESSGGDQYLKDVREIDVQSETMSKLILHLDCIVAELQARADRQAGSASYYPL